MTNYESQGRSRDEGLVRAAIDAASARCSLAALEHVFRDAGLPQQVSRATLVWMLKYDLLRTAP